MDPNNTNGNQTPIDTPQHIISQQTNNLSETNTPGKNPLKKTVFILIPCLILIALIGSGGFILGSKSQKPYQSGTTELPTVPPSVSPTSSNSQSGMKTYTSQHFGYSFQYPSDLVIKGLDTSGRKHYTEVTFVSSDTQYDKNGGWAISGVQLSVSVTDASVMDVRATSVPELLPAKITTKKVRTIEGYTETGGDGIPYIVSISTNSLAPDYLNTPAEVDFICFSPSGDRCKIILPQMISTFSFP